MITPVVERARRMAVAMFLDTATITRPSTSAPILNPATGAVSAAVGATVYDGPCRIRMPNATEMQVLFGEQQVTRTRFVGLFPWDLPVVHIGDIVTVTDSADPYAAGRRFRILNVPTSSILTHRRLALEVVE